MSSVLYQARTSNLFSNLIMTDHSHAHQQTFGNNNNNNKTLGSALCRASVQVFLVFRLSFDL